MSTRENRRSMNVINDTLRADNASLRSRQSEMLSHIQTLIRRQKQLAKLRQQLLQQSQKAKDMMMRERISKEDKCMRLQIQLDQMSNQMSQIDLTLANLEEEYQICLKDYDNVLAEIKSVLQINKSVQSQLTQQVEKRTTIQAMIFDYERLQRVLQEEKRYFRELATTEQKSHGQRMKEFQSIREKLIKEEKESFHKKFMDRFRIGYIKLNNIFRLKFKQNAQTFIRGFFKFQKLTDLGISKFKNCLELATTRYKKELRRTLTGWHHNVFNKATLSNIVENSLKLNFESRTKIKVLNKIVEKLNSDNLSLLHLYERTKIVCLTATTIKRKQVHLTFCRWREQSAYLTRAKYRLQKVQQTILTVLKRNSFNLIKDNLQFLKRYQVASRLLTQYENTKGMAWAMRKWRWQVANREINVIQKYVENMKKFSMIQQRIKYEKRKVKALTNLQLFLSKIQLRNYFSRYYQNVKVGKIIEVDQKTQVVRDLCGEARKENKAVKLFYAKKNKEISLVILFNRLNRYILTDAYHTLKKHYEVENARRHALLLVLLKKQGKAKYYVMNEFRRNVQFYQKKQMHQILTDLNHKMEEINGKSTQFRQALKVTTQDLAVQSSRKINQLYSYTRNYQKKMFFDWYSRKSIEKDCRYYTVDRMVDILCKYAEKNIFRTIKDYCKEEKKDQILARKQKKYFKQKEAKTIRKAFYGLLNQLKTHKTAFSKLIHVQNVMYFYRLECALMAMMKKSHHEKLKVQQKHAEELNKKLVVKKQGLDILDTRKGKIEEQLRGIFIKFVNFQQISQRNKDKAFLQRQSRKYFRAYRKNALRMKHAQEVLSSFVKLLQYKNYFIFWKSILITSYESQQVGLKDQLAKINKKRKVFDERIYRTKTDMEKRVFETEKEHQAKQTLANYYLGKYQKVLSYYDVKHKKHEEQLYMTKIFRVWKRESLGTKKFCSALEKIFHRVELVEPCQKLYQKYKQFDNQYKSELLCVSILQKKYKRQLVEGFNLWRYNMRHGYNASLKAKLDNIDEYREQVRRRNFLKAQDYANEVIRNKKFALKTTIFMALKNERLRCKRNAERAQPLIDKSNRDSLQDAMARWKWLAYYKRTKRAYLKHKQQIFNKQLKRDVFLSLKIHRQQIYHFANLAQNYISTSKQDLIRFAISKIVNIASYEKNQLNYQRRKAMHTLLMKKLTRQKLIKRTVMWKWQSQLIPRKHYLPNVLHSIQMRIMKSALAKINGKKYWNEFYIKGIAQKITSEGYSDINSVTNILIREGFDPDELKDYLKKKNQTDVKIIKNVVGHIKMMAYKPRVLKAFHSWKEYVTVRKNIKRAFSKVFSFSTGLGRYFDKWRKKDPVFNEILQRESRENMLQRYYDLQNLMKEYRRDVNNSYQNCMELQQVNDQYAATTKMTVEMAFSNLANSVHKGMKQGFEIWRIKAKDQRIKETNRRYDQLVDGIQMLDDHKRKIKQKISALESQNLQLKERCRWGQECGQLLKNLMSEKDGLTIDLAEKQHNLKILLEDNLRLKQKIKIAQTSAIRLISKIRDEENIDE